MEIQYVQAIVAAGITSLVVIGVHFAGRHRDNKERFAADRRTAYADFLTAMIALRDVVNRNEPEDAAALKRSMEDARRGGGDEQVRNLIVDIHRARTERTRDRSARARDQAQSACNVIFLLAPESVRQQLANTLELPQSGLLGEPGQIAIQELIKVMRADLGIDPYKTPPSLDPAGAMTWSAESIRGAR